MDKYSRLYSDAIVAKPESSEDEAAFATLQKFLQDHDISPGELLNKVMSRVAYCVRHYTKADVNGNPVVEMNLGSVTLRNRPNARADKRKERRSRPNFDSSF